MFEAWVKKIKTFYQQPKVNLITICLKYKLNKQSWRFGLIDKTCIPLIKNNLYILNIRVNFKNFLLE